MGQVTLPVLNRKGYSSVWENHWESKLNFTKQLNEDMFFKEFFRIFFKNWLSYQTPIFWKNYKSKSIDSKVTRFKKFKIVYTTTQDLKLFLKKTINKRFTYNFSKLFLIRFQNWIIMYVYIYVPQVWINRLQKRKVHYFNKNYIDSLYKHNTMKLLYMNNNYYRLFIV